MLKTLIEIFIPTGSIISSLAGLLITRKTSSNQAKIDQHHFTNDPAKIWPFVSILVPARNEETNIEECLLSIINQDYPQFEIIVVDDNSSDNTPLITKALVEKFPGRIQFVEAGELPPGWTGKNNGLYQGYQKTNAASEWLLFLDADVRLVPGSLATVVDYALSQNYDMVSLSPAWQITNFWLQLLVPEMAKLYAIAQARPFKPVKAGSVEEAAAVGTFILAKKYAYELVGGHSAVRDKVLEDVELARLFRSKGFTTIITGSKFVRQNLNSFKGYWESCSKNWFYVAREEWATVVFIIVLEGLYGLAPLLLLARQALNWLLRKQNPSSSWRLNLVAAFCTLLQQRALLKTLYVPARFVFLYPLSALLSTILVLESSIRIGLLHSVYWKDRNIKLEVLGNKKLEK